MESTERQIEAAEAMVARERDQAVARIREGLCLKGDEFCIGCGEPIEPARRAALPSALRCIECQRAHERKTCG